MIGYILLRALEDLEGGPRHNPQEPLDIGGLLFSRLEEHDVGVGHRVSPSDPALEEGDILGLEGLGLHSEPFCSGALRLLSQTEE